MNLIRNIIERIHNRKRVKMASTARSINTEYEGRNTVFAYTVVSNSKIGLGTYIGKACELNSIKIGRYCSIADHVFTVLGSHPTNRVSTYPAFYYDTISQLGFTFHSESMPNYNGIYKYPSGETRYQVVVGNDVWIGSHVLLIGGIRIGDGAVVAAGSVVVKDVEPYAIVGGVPAKLIRKRFEQKYIDFLLQYKWWEKDFEHIRRTYRNYMLVEELYDKENS